MEESFYRAFEEKHRGSRELIKSRLAVYLPFVLHCRKLYEECRVLDLGCGRGEWLELMMENDCRPIGVDLDEGMLAACRERNISVEKKDLLAALKEQSSESLVVVSAFHVVEHLPFEVLQEVIKESLRVLKPGGLLILETPNPENILVATSNFYTDPTHIRPIPQLLLAFLTDFYGFKRNKLLRLQESKEIIDSGKSDLLTVLCGVSPDYAVIAQKDTSSEQLALFDVAFEKEYGLSLESLGKRYEEGIEKRFLVVDAKLQQSEATSEEKLLAIEAKLQQSEATGEEKLRAIEAKLRQSEATGEEKLRAFEAKLQQSEAAGEEKLRAIEAKLRQSEATGEEKLRAIEAKLQQSEATLKAVYESRSWRITAPLRFLGRTVKWIRKKSKAAIKSIALNVGSFVLRHPRIKIRAVKLTRKFPVIETRIRRLLHEKQVSSENLREPEADGLSELSVNARRIYFQLETALEQKKKERE